jgi:hypothetical protein
MSISDWVFGNVWSCSTLFIMKTSHKSDELKKFKKGGSTNRVPMLIWTINITTLKVIFKLYGDLPGPNLFWAYWSAWKLSVCHSWFEWFKTNIVYSTIHVLWKGEGHRKSTLIKIVQIGKIFFVTKNLENTNNILMTKKSRIQWGYKILETGRLNYSLSLFN